MEEIKEKTIEEVVQDKLNDAGGVLLEVKCLVRLTALAYYSYIIDDELQLQENLAYYFILRNIIHTINQIDNILDPIKISKIDCNQ